MAQVRVLTERELTVALLARQLLLARTEIPIAQAVQRLAALQAQYSPSPYIALHARLAGFQHGDLEAALRDRTVVKATLMRGTLHLVAGCDYGAFAGAWHRQSRATMRARTPAATSREGAVLAALAAFTAEPRSTDQLRAKVRELTAGTVPDPLLLDYVRIMLPLVHAPPSGFWRHHGKPSLICWPEPLPEDPAATALLVRRYLAAFGPATREDIAHFTYLRFRQIDPALAALGPLHRCTDTQGRDLLDLADGPLPDEDQPLPVRFLARWDAAIISHKDRTRILPTAYQARLTPTPNGMILSSYLIDGKVAGIWSHNQGGAIATLTLQPFDAQQESSSSALEAEGDRLLAFLAPMAEKREITFAPIVN
ncbi:MAG TPA: winged helix DNA-binding domain-containing protein [Thermomicrobiales bacterium]